MGDPYIPENILVTGGAGFIGSWFTNLLIENNIGKKIIVIDKISYCSRINNILYLDNIKFIKGNINNKDLILLILEEYNIDTIIHFAASTHVDNSFDNSIDFTVNNILGTHNLVDCCRNKNIKRFIHISTDEVYGEIEQDAIVGFDELKSFEPTNPYAATKAAAEHIVKSYFHSYKFPSLIVRANNTFGPGQYPEKIFPKFILYLLKNKNLTIHGKGSSMRNYIFVDDTCKAILHILKYGSVGESYNIGANHELNVLEVANLLINKINPDLDKNKCIEYVEDRKFNDKRYFLNSNKLKNIGWKGEETLFEDAINKTIEWYKINKNDYNEI